ncbi:DUF6340 family protein [Rhodohalobacter mucosus]|uniref:Tetratricopeptide repeat protein n=1 Tax=Rhodohalobacter mucosus TaxID=2079485 RepID=A0A316TPE9_9BACT|nr:DUF6340 family protein [Rhodohalobacter mucosus]PWN06280.1 hypothetical protein DDZ15_10665 [Rhodohalobacter mucosus]
MKQTLSVFLLMLFTGCSATNTLTLSVMEPAAVHLSPEVERVGVLNRTLSEEPQRALETLDQIFSVKGPELDSLGAEAGLDALKRELSMNNRFSDVVFVRAVWLENTPYGTFPSPLSWDHAERISRENDVQAIFSLEYYDTDSNIGYSTRTVMVEGPLGIEVPVLEHIAEVQTSLEAGWRVYDSEAMLIRDEFLTGDEVLTIGSGINPGEAVKALSGRTEAVQAVSREMGMAYAQRVLPYWIRVERDYFVKGNDQFELAKRRAQTGNWEGAGEIWFRQTLHSDPRIAGRAHYNMGIISEINGNLEEAIDWVRMAYEDYGEKRALDYLRILQNRLAADAVLKHQQTQ